MGTSVKVLLRTKFKKACFSLAREHANEAEHDYTDKLKRIQTVIIDISTAISRSSKVAIPPVYTKELEDWISEYSTQLPPPEQYIIPVRIAFTTKTLKLKCVF